MTNSNATRDPSSFTFEVDDVQPGKRVWATDKIHQRLGRLTKRRIESCCDYHTDVCCNHDYQPLLAAVYTAYNRHLPLTLGPDAVWLTIAQGVAHHMAVHGESLRHRFVAHAGKIELKLEVRGWIPGTPENPWDVAFENWTGQIKNYVGNELYDNLMCDFSTTDKSSRIASQIVMMDIFETYFKYRVMGVCGIPSVTLNGTEQDWDRLAIKVRSLRVFDMDWWLDALVPLVDRLAETRRGIVNVEHWRNICKRIEAYGGDEINGWIAYFFPYLREGGQGTSCRRLNPIFENGRGFSTYSAPTGLSQVPFVWQHTDGSERLMNAIGGLVGVKQNLETLALEPIAGWAVCEAAPFDTLLYAVKDLVVKGQTDASADDLAETEESRELIQEYMPDDLDRFFHELGDCIELKLRGSELTIKLRFPSLSNALRWGNEPDEDELLYRPFAKSWFKIASLRDARFLAVNLDPNYKYDLPDPPDGRTIPLDIRCPIAVCSDSTVGRAEGNPVVAFTFTELLEKLIHSKSGDEYYWDAEGFQPYFEAQTMACNHKG